MRVALLLIAFLAAMAANARPASADELLTTWRAGDRISYGAYCISLEAINRVVEHSDKPEVVAVGCFGTRRPMFAVLVQWISGPYEGAMMPLHVWEIYNEFGETVYILLGSDTGPHQAEAML